MNVKKRPVSVVLEPRASILWEVTSADVRQNSEAILTEKDALGLKLVASPTTNAPPTKPATFRLELATMLVENNLADRTQFVRPRIIIRSAVVRPDILAIHSPTVFQ